MGILDLINSTSLQSMPHSFGYKARTRHLYAKNKYVNQQPSKILNKYKIGDSVDILCDSSIQKGTPFRLYYGKTGKIWNITKRSVGVELFKKVSNRMRTKKIHVRIEHVRHSRCSLDHKQRVKENEIQKQFFNKGLTTKKKIIWKLLKREPVGPKCGYLLKKSHCTRIQPL